MLKVEAIEGRDALMVISDDANAENMALNDAVELVAPHLHQDFSNVEVDENGLLQWRVERAEWDSLLEVLDSLEDIDPDEQGAAALFVEGKTKEVQG